MLCDQQQCSLQALYQKSSLHYLLNFSYTDSSSGDENLSSGSQSGTERQSQSQFLDDTKFQQRPKKRKSPVQESQVTQQKQSQLDQVTVALTIKLTQMQQDEDKDNDKRALDQSMFHTMIVHFGLSSVIDLLTISLNSNLLVILSLFPNLPALMLTPC